MTFDDRSTFADRFAWAQWRTLALLESQVMRSRYHEAGVSMMIRVYIVFLGFATGVVMALVGAAFILGKLHESASSVNAGSGSWRLALQSSSPGLFLAFFGTMLILATIWARSDVNLTYGPLYVAGRAPEVSASAPAGKTPERTTADIRQKVRQAEVEKEKRKE